MTKNINNLSHKLKSYEFCTELFFCFLFLQKKGIVFWFFFAIKKEHINIDILIYKLYNLVKCVDLNPRQNLEINTK